MINSFVHLHSNSEYSLLRSSLKIKEMVRLAKENSMEALALTDCMNLHAAIEFYDECYNNGINPIIGAELLIEPLSEVGIVDSNSPATYELVVLAKNMQGYENLCRLLTLANNADRKGHSFVKKDLFKELAGEWIVLSGGVNSEIFTALANDQVDRAREVAEFLAYTAGPGNFFIELQWHELPIQRKVLPELKKLAKNCNFPIVATNACRYACPEDAISLEILAHIERGTSVDSIKELTPEHNQQFFRSAEDIANVFRNAPEAIENTKVIADQCVVVLPVGQGYLFPDFVTPDDSSMYDYIQKLCHQGLLKHFPAWDEPDDLNGLSKAKRKEISKRLAFELDVIYNMGFLSYFLIVQDFIQFAKDNDIPVGPGRGSAAGSLVSFLLGITEVNPLEFNLLFERFLNPARKKMPDIDIDFCENRREEVIEYVREKYGQEHVAQISTFSKLKYKATLKAVGKILKAPDSLINQIAELVIAFYSNNKHSNLWQIAYACKSYKPMLDFYLANQNVKNIIDLCVKIEGLPRHLSTHAAGVVIAPNSLLSLMPLSPVNDSDYQSQFDMHSVERLGLLKMDFLGLTTLTTIDHCIANIQKSENIKIDLPTLDLKDKGVYELLCSGNLLGIFQLEASAGVRSLVNRLQPSDFNDIIALLALYRPGPMHNIDDFIERRHDNSKVKYQHPKLEKILKETYGIMIYQEQIMQCLHSLLGYTLAEADIFRQIMSKKNVAKIKTEKVKFMQHAKKMKLEDVFANSLFSDIARFAEYGFNKSHATAYAVIAFQTAYLKAHFPAYFMAAIINSRHDNSDNFNHFRISCQKAGVSILPPCVNNSRAAFTVQAIDNDYNFVRFGLQAVKFVGNRAAEEIVKARQDGPFVSVDDFCHRINSKIVNKKAVDSLIKAGACDFSKMPRQRMTLIADDILSSQMRKSESDLQRSFFDIDGAKDKNQTKPSLSTIEEWDQNQLLAYEKEVTGLYMSFHPLKQFSHLWHAITNFDSEKIENKELVSPFLLSDLSRFNLVIAGLITQVEWRTSRTNHNYGLVTLEDFYGTIKIVLWSNLVDQYKDSLEANQIWFVRGKTKETFGQNSFIAESFIKPEHASQLLVKSIKVFIAENKDVLQKLTTVLANFPGKQKLKIVIQGQQTITLDPKISVNISEDFLAQISEFCSYECIDTL